MVSPYAGIPVDNWAVDEEGRRQEAEGFFQEGIPTSPENLVGVLNI
ncbi:hypothetical protein NIES4074_42350 [Cylindrospermum sp. NIES-4074]|nr:hypothetical protein NIES4074_42350 [Cylindrospermum sp. NIES-4074]